MSIPQGSSSALKRKQPESISSQSLSKDEQLFYGAIRDRKSNGIWARNLKEEIKHLPDKEVTKVLKSLAMKGLIKEVVNIRSKAKKPHYVAAEFEPSAEITGGTWYSDGNLDTELIAMLKQSCISIVKRTKIATVEGVTESLNNSKAFVDVMENHQVEQILSALVLESNVVEEKSDGKGEFRGIPVGKTCYKSMSKVRREIEQKVEALASIPCGVCSRTSMCTPNGRISPATCIYFTKWLALDF